MLQALANALRGRWDGEKLSLHAMSSGLGKGEHREALCKEDWGGCPGQCLGPHSWRYLRDMWIWP